MRGRERERAALFGARSLAAGAALTLVAAPFGLLLLLVEAAWDPLLDVDETARDRLHAYALGHPVFVTVLKAVSTLGTSGVYLPAAGLLAWWLVRRGRRRSAVYVACTVAGSPLLNSAVKALVGRARPTLTDPVATAGFSSFPSGHAQAVVVAAGVLLVVARHRPRRPVLPVLPVAGLAWVLLMGFSRVALGVHYVSDVLAGYALGVAWLVATTTAFRAWRQEDGSAAAYGSGSIQAR